MSSTVPFTTFSRTALRLSTTAAVGMVMLAGCSSTPAENAAFCETSSALSQQADKIDSLVPDEATLAAARAGDFTALNEWGVQADETITDVGAQFQETLDAAPNEEIGAALDTYLAMMDVLQQMAVAGAEAADIETFSTEMTELNTDAVDLSTDVTEANQVLADADQEYCQ